MESESIRAIRRRFSVYSRDSITTKDTAVQESGWPFVSASWNAMEAESGSSPLPERVPLSTSPSPDSPSPSAQRPVNLLLAEDNLPDVLLVREAIRQEKLPVELFTVADGEKAIEFLRNAELDSA